MEITLTDDTVTVTTCTTVARDRDIDFDDILDAIVAEPDDISIFDTTDAFAHELVRLNQWTEPDYEQAASYIRLDRCSYRIEPSGPMADLPNQWYSYAHARGMSKQAAREWAATMLRQFYQYVRAIYHGDLYSIQVAYSDADLDIYHSLAGIDHWSHQDVRENETVIAVAGEIAQQYQNLGFRVHGMPTHRRKPRGHYERFLADRR